MCWRRMEKISWTDRVRNEVLHKVKEEKIVSLRVVRIGRITYRKLLELFYRILYNIV